MGVSSIFLLAAAFAVANAGDYVEQFERWGCLKYKKHHVDGEGGYHVLDASGPTKWPTNGFCRASAMMQGTSVRYTLHVQLMNQQPSTGHPGVMFNMQESNTFDFIYFRPHSAGSCYQVGYSSSGTNSFTSSGPCAGGTPQTGVWFDVIVEVLNNNAKAYVNGNLVKSWTAKFGALPRGGVMAANGYQNIIRFANFHIDV